MPNLNRRYIPLFVAFGLGLFWLYMFFVFQYRHDSALLDAIIGHDVQAARQAFTDGATMRMPLRLHSTFLHAAAYQGNVEMAKLLVEHGAAERADAEDDEGHTALYIAQVNGHTEMADYLRSLMATNHAKDAP